MCIQDPQEVDRIVKKSLFNEMISVEQLHAVVTGKPDNVVLLDIRCPAEHHEGVIPGSWLFPNDHNLENRNDTSLFRQSFESRFRPDKFDPDKSYILVCRSGPRTEIALETFLAHGFAACELIGGVMEWLRMGFPLTPMDGMPVIQ
ncbi:MAG: rhodanese-like domain-containing protein [Magnetococcales bacterium]|nr:rhodanese-like domain-containing protein [Magnetococcales bacterium]